MLAYDLHMHTAASPCGDDYMTPNNIVNMSIIKGLDVIAITDHQTVANCEAVMRVGQKNGLKVICGMEIECQEEFHLITLFPSLEVGKEMEKWLWQYLPPIQNKPSIFGMQQLLDEDDNCIGEINQLLLVPAQVSADEIIKKARSLKALIYPAHIDRMSYSIVSNLGSIPEDYHFKYIEISKLASYETYQQLYTHYTIIQSSDAHYLENISEREAFIELHHLEPFLKQ